MIYWGHAVRFFKEELLRVVEGSQSTHGSKHANEVPYILWVGNE